MGLTTEEEHVCFYFCFLFRLKGKLIRVLLMGVGEGRVGRFGHGWPSDEETLGIRVDRIEDKPLGCHQFGNQERYASI